MHYQNRILRASVPMNFRDILLKNLPMLDVPYFMDFNGLSFVSHRHRAKYHFSKHFSIMTWACMLKCYNKRLSTVVRRTSQLRLTIKIAWVQNTFLSLIQHLTGHKNNYLPSTIAPLFVMYQRKCFQSKLSFFITIHVLIGRGVISLLLDSSLHTDI